jgi:hypothetical protein
MPQAEQSPSYFVIEAPLAGVSARSFWKARCGMVGGQWGSLSDATRYITVPEAAKEIKRLVADNCVVRGLRVIRVSVTTRLEEEFVPVTPPDRWVVVSAEGEFLERGPNGGWSMFLVGQQAWCAEGGAAVALDGYRREDPHNSKLAQARVMRVSFSEIR